MKITQLIKSSIALLLFWGSFSNLKSQESKPTIAVTDIDVRGHKMNGAQAIQFAINELMRIDRYEVMDRYDLEYLSRRDSLSLSGCFSKICLKEIGAKLKVDKMFTGSIFADMNMAASM